MAEESGDIYSKAMAYTAHGISCYGKGFLEEAVRHLLKGIDFSERINMGMFSAVASLTLGEVYYEIRDYQNSKDHYAKGVQLVEQSGGLRSWVTHNEIGVAKARVMMNEKDIDLDSLYVYVYENKLKVFESWKVRFFGEILLNIDDQHILEAEDYIKRAIEAHKRDDMVWYLARDYTLYADLLKRKGDSLKAKENLIKAIEIFDECGAVGWVKRTEKELESFS
jgi:tetratricopeptide (TPR) repeat protein